MTDMIDRDAAARAVLDGLQIGAPEEEQGAAALVNQALIAAADRVRALRTPDPYAGARRRER